MNYPILLKIGPLTIYSYGFFLTLAILSGTFLFWRNARREGFDEEKILDLALVSLVSGLLGARLVFVLANLSVFRGDLLDVLRSFSAGLSFFGGLVFGAVGFVLFVRRAGWSLLKLLDLAAPALAFSYGLGMVGTLLSGLEISAVVETAGHFLIFFGLVFFAKQKLSAVGLGRALRKAGFLAFSYFFLSGALRFAAGFYRVRSWGMPSAPGGRLTLDQVFSGLEMVIGGSVLGWWIFSGRTEPLLPRRLRDWLLKLGTFCHSGTESGGTLNVPKGGAPE